MGFFSKVARDIQVIITEAGGGKKKRQRFDPTKRKPKGKFLRRRKFFQKKGKQPSFEKKVQANGEQASSLNVETQRDFSDELRTLSFQALGRLLNRAYRNGDDTKAYAIEREIDRRTKGKMLSRFSRRR